MVMNVVVDSEGLLGGLMVCMVVLIVVGWLTVVASNDGGLVVFWKLVKGCDVLF